MAESKRARTTPCGDTWLLVLAGGRDGGREEAMAMNQRSMSWRQRAQEKRD